MNEDEKEAVEQLKKLLNDFDNEDISETDLFLINRLIEKQQEKIKELIAFYNSFKSEKIVNYPIFKQRYISKDKIREKIKELRDFAKTIEEEKDDAYFQILHKIRVLKELLEE